MKLIKHSIRLSLSIMNNWEKLLHALNNPKQRC